MENILKNLKTAIFNVLEKMYFLLADEETASGREMEDGHAVYIGIIGNPAHLITLVFDHDISAKMACDLLGMDEEPDNVLIQKNLQETANVIAGNYLLFFEDEERNVTLPRNRKEDVFGPYTCLERSELNLSFEGSPVTAILEVVETA